jgi:hypothetical protein
MPEIRPVPGLDGYFVSDAGEVFTDIRPGGKTGRGGAMRALKAYENARGYRSVSCKWTRSKKASVHRLVAIAFHGPPPPDHEVRHLDGNPRNNTFSNLAWGTHLVNMHDMYQHGTLGRGRACGDRSWTRKYPERVPRGDDHWSHTKPHLVRRGGAAGRAKISDDAALDILRSVAAGVRRDELAERHGVCLATVHHIATGRSWRHLAATEEGAALLVAAKARAQANAVRGRFGSGRAA